MVLPQAIDGAPGLDFLEQADPSGAIQGGLAAQISTGRTISRPGTRSRNPSCGFRLLIAAITIAAAL